MENGIYKLNLKDLEGNDISLSAFKGKVVLIVNIASRCGLTHQLKGLEELYEKYSKDGFEVLAFPSNDFNQEPKEADKITEFCTRNYGVKFPIFEKDHVRGKKAQPLYRYLAENSKMAFWPNYPVWNFQKYLVDKKWPHGYLFYAMDEAFE